MPGVFAQSGSTTNDPRPISQIEKDFPEKGSVMPYNVRNSLAVEYCAAKLKATKSEVQAAVNVARSRFGPAGAPQRAAELFFCHSERLDFFKLEYRFPEVTESKTSVPANGQSKFLDVSPLPNFANTPNLVRTSERLQEKMLARTSFPSYYSIIRAHTSSKLFYVGACGGVDVLDASFKKMHSLKLGDCEKLSHPTAIAFSSDGTRIAVGMNNGDVLLGQALATTATPESWKSCIGHTRWISELSFSPDGGTVFSTSDDGTARIWNAETCAEEKSIRLRGPSALGTNGLAYLYDKGKIAVLELKTGETARTYPVSLPSVSIVTKVILGEKAHTLLVGTFTNGVAAIDLKSGAVRSLAKNQGSGSALEARNPAAIATDGRLFAYVRGVNGATGYIQDTQATKPHVLEFELSPQEVRSVDFVPDRPNVLIALTRTGAFSSSGATATAWLISGTP
jgi:hypothetical protein